jgi:raffinose/stachyose/melibiose transport system substrate-binding protein
VNTQVLKENTYMYGNKRLLGIVLVSLFLLVSVAGVTAQDAVTIQWWHINTNENEAAYWQGLADAFVAEHPNVTIEITILENNAFKERLVTVMQANDPPDLFQSWGGGVLWSFADNGLVRNIAPELEGEWKDSFAAQAALELYGQNGEYYGVPWTWGAVGMFYNKALFEQAGLDPDNPPATWTELLAAVQTLKDAGITPIALGESEKWPGHFWWVYLAIRLGGQDAFLAAYNREGSFADEPFVQAGARLEELIALEPFPEGFLGMTYGDQSAAMGNGEAAIELMGQWAPAVQAGNSASGEGIGDDLGWFPFPVVEGGAGNPTDVLGGGDGFAVGANAPDETVEFLRFLTSAENQRAGAEIFITPVVNGLEDTYADDPIRSAIVEARNGAPYFQLYYDQFLPPAVGEAVNDAVETLFAGAATAEEAAAAIEESASFELE